MDNSELVRRLKELIINPVVVGDDGVARISPDFEPLENEAANALKVSVDIIELDELVHVLSMLKETLSSPEIIKSYADMSATQFEPQPDIFDAIEERDVEAVRAALQKWEINESFGEHECTALYKSMSAMFGVSLEVIDLLLDSGADPNKGLTDTNVLHGLGFANLDGNKPEELALVVRRCVELGADIEQRSNNLQWTPLITAVSEWNPVATEALLLAGADIRARAGETGRGCFSGADCLAFANGNAATLAVLKRFMSPC